MYPNHAVESLKDTLAIMKRHADHVPPNPELGGFYRTFNDSIVYIFQIDADGEANASILTGGFRRGGRYGTDPGETYRLTPDGYHADDDAGPHLVMALRERLDLRLPD